MCSRFDSIYSHGFLRAAVCVPLVRVADPAFNLARTLDLARTASHAGAALALFPELGLSAYSNEDLFHQSALLDAAAAAVTQLVEESKLLAPVLIAGAPLQFDGKLFNCAVVVYRGTLLGIVPKTYLPNYREFYEKRQFTSALQALGDQVSFHGKTCPFGNNLVFEAVNLPGFRFHVEICEDVWAPIPPSSYAALAGATILTNLSASNITVGKAEYRRELCLSHSGKCLAAYLYSAAGAGESTTDLAWDGQALICENSELLAETERFAYHDQIITADLDLERLLQERMRATSFNDNGADCRDRVKAVRHVPFEFEIPPGALGLSRHVSRFPYVPDEARARDQRCFEAYNIQAHGLIKRLSSSGLKRIVIGVSGGLDSTQALLVAAQAFDRMELPRENILACTMPGFATSDLTLANARKLMAALGVTTLEIDIRPSCLQMFRDIGHPFASGTAAYDITFENVQAGERTSHLFRLANLRQALVLGTGDLSELALGWTTYGVGDQMSHYNVNVSIPKTLIQHLIRWTIATGRLHDPANAVLQSILETEISPELVPHHQGDSTAPAQKTADVIGPYDLQDFNLYYITRYGFCPSKVAFLCRHAWGDPNRGSWPNLHPVAKRRGYDLHEIKKWLEVFLFRFFQTSQFKRSALPNGPKVGSGGSLSPRGDWRAPSDSEAVVWLEELRRNVPD